MDEDNFNKWYDRIRRKIEKEIPINNTIDDFNFNIRFLRLFKDKNNKKEFVNFINFIEEKIRNKVFDIMIKIIEKDFIEMKNIPSVKNIFNIIEDRIKSNENSIKSSEKELFKLEKKKFKLKDYSKISDLDSDIFWENHFIKGYKEKIQFYKEIMEEMKRDIKNESKN